MKLLSTALVLMSLIACAPQEVIVGPPGPQGPQGPQGDPAMSPYMPVAIVDPCSKTPGITNEVLIILSNGVVLVSFSDNTSGDNTRLAVLDPGNYMTTDGSRCYFTVTADGRIINEHF